MTITIVSAYLLIACYFVMERSLRKGKQALNLSPGAADASSSQVGVAELRYELGRKWHIPEL